jgi:UDP-N-acetylmuramoylalanine--D-glutamate ligase
VPHRLEQAGIVAGVTYVNDSKATNVDATLTALNAYPERTHLILGGRDKASDYRPVAQACAAGCKTVYLIGEATPLIAAAFAEVAAGGDAESPPEVIAVGTLERAVDEASKTAEPGDVVLLAPACASFDQYKNFEERGEHFKTLVRQLRKGSE